ncbi:MAG: tetraacyldisaccharide 4'-kinase [Salaquimonas sp.]|jgi:tetraacyldisaccharide 4'-kinase|nr:tetraacyldisaccharide 4'-kinase [Salaquimonas sp.]
MRVEEAPAFWWRKPGMAALALMPLSALWGFVSGWRMELAPSASVSVPVLCVGNFVTGGAGKTPTAIAICQAALKAGLKPGFLSRGHGGSLSGPLQVDPASHRATEVGDEPLLLAKVAPTVISADRPAGAARLIAMGCDFIILDDGFQNPKLAKDFNLVVVDARRGIGNGLTLPSGPLRAPLSVQMARADAVVIVGDGPAGDQAVRETARRGKPVYIARTVPVRKTVWKGRRCLAFAGIGDPVKFFLSLEEAGADLVSRQSFVDHHVFGDEEIRDLLAEAAEKKLELVTTSKDMARLRHAGHLAEELAERAQVFDIRLEFDDPRTATLLIDATREKAEARSLKRQAA